MKNSVPPPFARLREKEGVLDFINSLRSYKIGTLSTPSFTPGCFKNYATKLPVLFFLVGVIIFPRSILRQNLCFAAKSWVKRGGKGPAPYPASRRAKDGGPLLLPEGIRRGFCCQKFFAYKARIFGQSPLLGRYFP